LSARRERRALDHFEDVRQMAVFGRCGRIRAHAEFGRGHAAANGFRDFKLGAGFQAAQGLDQGLRRSPGVQQSADGHVAADSRKGVEVADFHSVWFTSSGKASAAGARQVKATILETGVSAGFTSTTLAPEAWARCTSPAAG